MKVPLGTSFTIRLGRFWMGAFHIGSQSILPLLALRSSAGREVHGKLQSLENRVS